MLARFRRILETFRLQPRLEEQIPEPQAVEEKPFQWKFPHESEPHPMNVPGDFYTEREQWDDAAPLLEAPDLIALDVDGKHYFKKQPETLEEIEQAINACAVSFGESVRYKGRDPAIISRFEALGRLEACDVSEVKK